MATRNAAILVDAKLAEAYNAAPQKAQKKVQAAIREMLQNGQQGHPGEDRSNGAKKPQIQAAHFSAKESKLLLTINRGLSAEQRRRSEELIDKMEYASIIDDEHTELMQLSQESEKLSAQRLKAMIELARNAGPDDCEMCGS